MKVRPVERRDLADIFELAGKTGVGMTSLPQNEQHLAARIERALNTWQGSLDRANKAICLYWKIANSRKWLASVPLKLLLA